MLVYVPFLGSRSYVHGTTLFEDLSLLAWTPEKVSVRFIRPITSNVLEIVYEDPSCPAVILHRDWCIGLKPTGEVTAKREDWNEAAEIEGAEIDGPTASMKAKDFIRGAVALNKAMLQKLCGGEYLMRRIDLERIPEGPQDFTLTLASESRGQYATDISGSVKGRIHFVRRHLQ